VHAGSFVGVRLLGKQQQQYEGESYDLSLFKALPDFQAAYHLLDPSVYSALELFVVLLS
jgi:hypothetical protein